MIKEEFFKYVKEEYENQEIKIVNLREVNSSLKIFLIFIDDEKQELNFEIITVLTKYIPANNHLKKEIKLKYDENIDANDLLSSIMQEFDNVYQRKNKKQML